MAKHLAVKAFLQYPEGLELGCSPDIKRFKLAKESADDKSDLYCRLVDTLHTNFPDIKGVNYSLYWKDAEGDMVEFTKKEEMQTAIDAMSDHVLRVYVIVHFDEMEDTTEAESDKEGIPKRVRFAKAGRRFRRRVRRRRRTALSDPVILSKEYRTGARLIVRHMHEEKDGGECLPHEGTALAELSPQVRDFIQQTHTEWHDKLKTQRPTVAARRMRMKERTLPPGLERDHFLWLVRLMGRWHRRHAGLCKAMSGWSSGDTDADESGGEEETLLKTIRKKRAKRLRHAKKAEKSGEGTPHGGTAEKTEDDSASSESHNVPKEFRAGVRVLMKHVHDMKGGKPADDQEKATLAALTPEVQAFVQKVADDWHTMLTQKQPRRVSKRIRKQKRSLPAGLQRDHYLWLCRYFRRWHARHATLCTVMSGWSSGEEEDLIIDDEGEKGGKDKESSSSSSSDSESDDDKKKKKEKKTVPKEFVKAIRILVNRLHNRKVGSQKGDKPCSEEQATLAALSPEVQTFVQSFAEEWDTKLAHKSPLLVARRMRKKMRSNVPAGLAECHIQFLCRFLSRWHSKNAVFCGSMAGWSSGETGGETSGDERSSWRRRFGKLMEDTTGSEQDDTDCIETACKPVSKEFRVGIRQWINQLHKAKGDKPKPKDDKEKKAVSLSPEVQQFLQRFAEEWHSKLSAKRPRGASKEMKASVGSLPSRMEREQYNWLCCYMARWHRKHPSKCEAMAGREMAGAEA